MPRLPLWTLALLGCAWLLAAGSLRAEESEVVAEPLFSADQLEQLVAPIALYPDSLVAQILMASTYPLEIVLPQVLAVAVAVEPDILVQETPPAPMPRIRDTTAAAIHHDRMLRRGCTARVRSIPRCRPGTSTATTRAMTSAAASGVKRPRFSGTRAGP